jgi:hypothetical protein
MRRPVSEQERTAHRFVSNYIRHIYKPKYLWLHLLLLGLSVSLNFYSADAWWAAVVLAVAQYVFLVASGLYAWIGWIMLRRADQIPLLPSVVFITACFSFALTLTLLVTPSPLQAYWWLGLIWPVIGFPMLFVFFKLLRLVRNTRARLQNAGAGPGNDE